MYKETFFQEMLDLNSEVLLKKRKEIDFGVLKITPVDLFQDDSMSSRS